MPTDIERLRLDGLDINDGFKFVVDGETFKFTAAEKKTQFIGNPDTDGEVLLEEAHYGNAFFEMDVQALEGGGPAGGRERLNQLVEALLRADRTQGGIPLIWRPTGSPDAAATNFIQNPSVETNTTGWAAQGIGSTIEKVTSDYFWGASSILVKQSGATANAGVQYSVPGTTPLAASKTYTVSVWVKAKEAGKTLRLLFRELTEAGGTVGDTTVEFVTTGNWQRVEATRTFGSTGRDAIIFVRNSAAFAFEAWVDALQLEEAAAATEYFDGDSGPTAWTGTPHESTSTRSAEAFDYTWYVLLGEINDVPVTYTGDDAGWFFDEPNAKVKLICRPFGYRAEKVVKAAVESGAEPQQEIYVRVGGHVPAEGRTVVTDKATQKRRYVEWGREVVLAEGGNPSILIKADDLVISGYGAKEKKAATNDYSTNSIYGNAFTSPEVAFATPVLSNVGSYRVKLRVQEVFAFFSGFRAELMWRVAYRVGDGPWGYPNSGEWQGPTPIWGKWCELDLGEVKLEKVEKGTQRCEMRVEVQINQPIGLFDSTEYIVDYLALIPTKGYGLARGAARIDVPTVFAALDDASSGEGPITGTELKKGGKWAGTGDAGDFSRSLGLFTRTTVSDEAGIHKGRLVTADGTTAMTDQVMSVQGGYLLGDDPSNNDYHWGVLCRADGTEANFLAAYMFKDKLFVAKRVASATTVLRELTGFPQEKETYYEMSLMVLASGMWFVAFGAPESSSARELLAAGYDSSLETGGALDNGRVGMFDRWGEGGSAFRQYRMPKAWVPGVPIVCESGQSLEIRADAVEREDAGGTFWGRVPEYRGGFMYLDPRGEKGQLNRLVVRSRRTDIMTETDEAITDKQTIEVLAKERVLYPVK